MQALDDVRALGLVVRRGLGQEAAQVAVEVAHPQIALGPLVHRERLRRQVHQHVVEVRPHLDGVVGEAGAVGGVAGEVLELGVLELDEGVQALEVLAVPDQQRQAAVRGGDVVRACTAAGSPGRERT